MQKQKMKKEIIKEHQENHKNYKDKNLNSPYFEQSETEEGSSTEVEINISLLKEIADTLTSIISENINTKNTIKEISPFNHDHVPPISLFDYLYRIQKYSGIEDSTLIIGLIYIDRICSKKKIKLTKNNIHRLLFTSIIIAIKYNEDIIYSNSFYSKIGGISLAELIKLENAFLKIIDFELFVQNDLYQKYYDYLNYYTDANE